MALIKCTECGTEISSNATACPKCGKPAKRKTKFITWVIGGIFTAFIVAMIVGSNTQREAESKRQAEAAAVEAAKSPEQRASEAAAKAKQEANFQRVTAVLRAIKANAKNPASFEVVQAGMTDAGSICVTYRATNSFNAVVTEYQAINKDNKIGDWNKLCAGKTLTNYTHAKIGI